MFDNDQGLNTEMKITFDVAHLYYLPQYLSVYNRLTEKKIDCTFVVYRDKDLIQIIENEIIRLTLPHIFVDSEEESIEYYKSCDSNWIIFGNSYKYISEIPSHIKTALINHGAGVKSVGYLPGMNQMDVRFVDGTHHYKELTKAFPDRNQVLVGFSKMDPLINNTQEPLDLKALGLDPNKQTLLYAPTFYPSSIEKFPNDFPTHFKDYNILIKFHFFSYIKKKYKAHVKRITRWNQYNNVYAAGIDEYSILPFLKSADLLISDASSTLFEFAALNKPVVWCDFMKLRFFYRGPFRFRYLNRLDKKLFQYRDIAAHVKTYNALRNEIDRQIEQPALFEKKRLAYTDQLLGPIDGKSSIRVADYLLNN